MKKVNRWSLIDGHAETIEVEDEQEFNNQWRYPWVGDGTAWEDIKDE